MPQVMRLLVPPTYEELLEDPVYASYAKKRPRVPENVRHGNPWMIVARRRPDAEGATWALKMMPDYADAYRRVSKLLESGKFEDVAIVSRRVLFKPPKGFDWNTGLFAWCGRCRRPSLFRECTRHHALRNAPVLTEDEPERCYYCGARRVFAGRFRPRR